MTILAGFFSRRAGRAIPDSACEALRRNISRFPGDEPFAFNDGRCCLLKVDIGAYGETAYRADGDGPVSVLAGEALLSLDQDSSAPPSRMAELDLLHQHFLRGDWSLLERASGVFCGVHYEPSNGSLSLFADKLCVRPLYYWFGEEFLAFATALRILESLPQVPRQMDVRAITEMTALGVPLGTRTPYAGVSLLRAAEVLRVSETNVERRQYWRWDEIQVSDEPEHELLSEAHSRFERAVERRIRADKTAAAFLSGGLDSRCVVAALRARDVHLHTFNFSPPGTMDQFLGLKFAKQAGTTHTELPMAAGHPNWTGIMAEAWSSSAHRSSSPSERPGLVWSGDGGSVGLGHVYVGARIVELMRAGETERAIEEFLQQQGAAVLRRLLQPEAFAALSRTLHQGVREELDDIHAKDPGRGFHIFLMLNDQRRHLADHFENIDLDRLEFQLPFLDSDFLASVMGVPVDLCLGHKFYNKWLKLFQPFVAAVPWQAYPGHAPCPLPVPPGLASQWDETHQAARREAYKRELLRRGGEVLKAPNFPDRILKKSYLQLATLVHRTGLRDYSYLIEVAQTYHKYWTICEGRYVLPQTSPTLP